MSPGWGCLGRAARDAASLLRVAVREWSTPKSRHSGEGEGYLPEKLGQGTGAAGRVLGRIVPKKLNRRSSSPAGNSNK